MSGIRVGTRLDRLIDLRRQVDDEITRERRRIELGVSPTATPTSTGQPEQPPVTLQDLGKTALEVRRWALDEGLVDRITTGRIPQWLIDYYAASHPEAVWP